MKELHVLTEELRVHVGGMLWDRTTVGNESILVNPFIINQHVHCTIDMTVQSTSHTQIHV